MSESNFEALLMKAVDGVLTEAEERELEAYLEAHPEAVDELEDYREIKEVTDQMTERMLADARLEPFRETPGQRSFSWVAFAMIFAGLTMILAFTFERLFADPDVPWAIRFGAALVLGGVTALFLRTLWRRVRTLGTDPYEEIDR